MSLVFIKISILIFAIANLPSPGSKRCITRSYPSENLIDPVSITPFREVLDLRARIQKRPSAILRLKSIIFYTFFFRPDTAPVLHPLYLHAAIPSLFIPRQIYPPGRRALLLHSAPFVPSRLGPNSMEVLSWVSCSIPIFDPRLSALRLPSSPCIRLCIRYVIDRSFPR